jgi:anthranilate synthase/aminodeoxychorismate synthase-like glutamine amidotransferase
LEKGLNSLNNKRARGKADTMVIVIDNYDSFTYNLVQYFGELGARLKVYRNDKVDIATISKARPDRIVISPGPCTPSEAGISKEVISAFSGRVPILGVCLGHQCIGAAFGGIVVRADSIMHGKTSEILHTKKDILFKDIPSPFKATRYHSLLIKPQTVPACLKVIAWTKNKEIMAVKHRTHQTWGVQFHPESILTEYGKVLLANFLSVKCS